jgi:hypothetical protein
MKKIYHLLKSSSSIKQWCILLPKVMHVLGRSLNKSGFGRHNSAGKAAAARAKIPYPSDADYN